MDRDNIFAFGRPPKGWRRVTRFIPYGGRRSTILLLALVGALTVAHLMGYGQAFPTLDGFLSGRTGSTTQAPDTITGVASVIDGDTLEIHGQRIRLYGIDAPESRQTCRDAAGRDYRCGQQAAIALSDRIGRLPASCEKRDVDRYKRIVAVCRLGRDDLNAWLVSEGHAMAYRQYSSDYVSQEARAREARRGIWRGEFTAPWDWRRR